MSSILTPGSVGMILATIFDRVIEDARGQGLGESRALLGPALVSTRYLIILVIHVTPDWVALHALIKTRIYVTTLCKKPREILVM